METNLLICFSRVATEPRPRAAGDEPPKRPGVPLEFCGWCNRHSQPAQKPDWLNLEQTEYAQGLRIVSPSSVRIKLCDDCTKGLVRSHEPEHFQHLSLKSQQPASVSKTMHRVPA